MLWLYLNKGLKKYITRKAITYRNNKKDDGKGVRIVEDMIQSDYQLKTKAYKQMQEAFKAKKKVRFSRGKLYIEGKEEPIV